MRAFDNWEPVCGVGEGARIIGRRRGLTQIWPVYDRRPAPPPPTVVGGTCPPRAPLQKVAGGYSCVEQPEHYRWALGQEAPAEAAVGAGELATTMVLRGAVGTLVGAAASPEGREGVWGAVGFVMGATMGELGIVGVALAALWKKAG